MIIIKKRNHIETGSLCILDQMIDSYIFFDTVIYHQKCCNTCFLLHRCWCARRSHVRSRWTRWLVLPEHGGAVGSSGPAMELRRTDVHSTQYSWCRRFRQQVSMLGKFLDFRFNTPKFKFKFNSNTDVLHLVVFQRTMCVRAAFEWFFWIFSALWRPHCNG